MKSFVRQGFLVIGILFLWANPEPASGGNADLGAQPPDLHSLSRTSLTAMRQRGRLVIGIKDNLYPLGYRNADGELTGFEVALAHKLATELLGSAAADSLELVPLSNRDRIPALTQGTVDLVIAQLTATDDRRRLVQFSPTYYSSGIQLMTHQLGLNRWEELEGQSIGVLSNSDAEEIVRVRFPRSSIVTYSSYRSAIQGLTQGEVAAFGGDAAILAGLSQQRPGEYQLLGPRLSSAPLAIAFPKGIQQTQLRQRLDAIVRGWQQSGWLQEEAQRWGLP